MTDVACQNFPGWRVAEIPICAGFDSENENNPTMSRLKLRFYDDLALHSAVADSATIAAVERVGSRCARHKFHHCRNSLFQLEAVISVRTKNERYISLLVRSTRAEVSLGSV